MSELSNLPVAAGTTADQDFLRQTLHDLRSPMTVLKILLARLDDTPHSYSRELIGAVFERMEMISASLAEKTAQTPRSLPQAVYDVVREKSVEYEGRVNFVSTVNADTAGARIDACEVMRMLSNLINNSIEAGAKRVQIKVTRQASTIQISVADDGLGFSAKVLQDLNSGIAHLVAAPGHGHGLLHARRLAQALGGDLWIRTAPAGGSCVTLSFPTNDAFYYR